MARPTCPAPYRVRQPFLEAIGSDPGLKAGVNTFAGHCSYQAVVEAQSPSYTSIDALIEVTSALTAN